MLLPRYPIYVPSKSRYATCLTPKFLIGDSVPFMLVVEPQETAAYAERFGADRLLVLPERDQGLIFARNWIKQHATEAGYERHWQLDDNLRAIRTWYRGKRVICSSGLAFAAVEDFVDRYENVAIAGLNYESFAIQNRGHQPRDPFWLNNHVYSCTLVLNAIPHRWRSVYNDDTDICLQVLADGWCTVLFNAFMCNKVRTMTMRGGNTNSLYEGDGRLKMARSLERMWPGVVRTGRRWQRPQHVVADEWKRFDTQLKLKPGVDPAAFDASKYALELTALRQPKSARLKSWLADKS